MPAYTTLPSMIGNFSTDTRGYAQTKIAVLLADLPTADPKVDNAIWNNSGTPTKSSG